MSYDDYLNDKTLSYRRILKNKSINQKRSSPMIPHDVSLAQ